MRTRPTHQPAIQPKSPETTMARAKATWHFPGSTPAQPGLSTNQNLCPPCPSVGCCLCPLCCAAAKACAKQLGRLCASGAPTAWPLVRIQIVAGKWVGFFHNLFCKHVGTAVGHTISKIARKLLARQGLQGSCCLSLW